MTDRVIILIRSEICIFLFKKNGTRVKNFLTETDSHHDGRTVFTEKSVEISCRNVMNETHSNVMNETRSNVMNENEFLHKTRYAFNRIPTKIYSKPVKYIVL